MGSDLKLTPVDHDPSLVGYWKLNEGSGTVAHDSSQYGNIGMLINNPTWENVSCLNGGNCLFFSGGSAATGSYVNVPDAPSLQLANSQEATFMAWINPGGTWSSEDGGRVGIITKYYTNYELETYGVYGQFGWDANLGSPSGVLIDNTWQQLAATYDHGTVRVYLNGNLEGTLTGIAAIGNGNQALSLGYAFDRWNATYVGYMEKARIYSRALSASEIQAIYNAEK